MWFGTTPARTAGWVVSAVAALLLGGIALYMPNGLANRESRNESKPAIPQMALGVSILLVIVMLLLPGRWFRHESNSGLVEPADFPLNVSLDHQIELLAFDLDKSEARPGDWLDLTLYWQAEVEPSIDFQVFVHLLGPDGNLVAQSDKLNPGDFPTRRWTTDKYVTDQHLLQLPESLPAGEYNLTAGLWVMNDGWRLPVLADDGTPSGDVVIIDQIHVTDN